MKRLTYRSSCGDYGTTYEYEDSYKEIHTLINALGKYEDLGYTPEEIKSKLDALKIINEKADELKIEIRNICN